MKGRAIISGAAATIALGLGACGSDDEKSGGEAKKERSRLAISISGSDKQPTVEAPKTVTGGLTEITVTNSARDEHSAQIIRFDKGHTAAEAIKQGNAWGDGGKPLPEWITITGGVGDVLPGQTGIAVQQLEPGDYVAFDLNTGASAEFKVSGEGAGGAPSAPASIAAVEYSFKATGLKAGKQKVLFDNKGKQPHLIAAAPMKPGKTIADVRKFIQTEKGESPVDEQSDLSTAVIEGGTKQQVELDLKSGKYALLCFVPDRQGGPPHIAKGMISEAEVR
jgi:hypothetical protein